MADAHKNFALSTIATAPSPAASGTSLVVAAGEGTKFPTPPFNATVWPVNATPTTANAEIVRVTGIATDTLTITRSQESTSARTIVIGDQIAATITARTLTDLVTTVNGQQGAVVLAAADVGLGNVDNTSDATKNSATATFTNKTMSGATNTFSNIPESAVTSLTTDLAARVQLAGDLGGTAAVPKVKSRTTLVVGSVLGQNADYVCDGTADDVELQTAVTAISAASNPYTKLYVLPGTYNVNANIAITGSNIDIELAPGATIKAAARTDSSFKSEYRGIFYLRNSTAGATQKNVVIHGGTIDCNLQTETSAMAIWGSGNTTTVYGTQNILVYGMTFKNKGSSTNSPALVQIHSVTDLGLGRVQGVKFRDCVFDTSDLESVRLRGSYINSLMLHECEFKNNAKYTINLTGGSETPVVSRTFSDIYVSKCYFHDNMTFDQGQTEYDFGMASRLGVKGLFIVDNTFDGSGEFKDNDNPHLQIYSSEGVHITSNTFRDTRQALSLGYSNGGTPFFSDPNYAILIKGNHFIRVHGTITDNDQNTRCIWEGNTFYKCGLNVGQAYAGHAYDIFRGNLLYNMNHDIGNDTLLGSYNSGTTTATLTAQQKSCISISGQNKCIVEDNYFIDDRVMNDPASTSSTSVTTVAGGALSSRTYYYRFAYRNVSGTTMASPSTSVAVGVNTLLKISPTGSASNARPADSTTLPVGVSAIEYIDIYVGTAAGSETLQASIPYPDFNQQNTGWTESTSGLASGAALPSSNTTHALTTYGIYEATSGGGYLGANVYRNNYFFGIAKPNAIYSTDPTVTRSVLDGNTYHTDLSGNGYRDDSYIYDQGNITGATTFTRWNGAVIRATLTGNVTLTLTNGYIIGEELTMILIQDATGSRTITWPGNFKPATGSLVLSTAASAVDTVTARWDGTNWREIARGLNRAASVAEGGTGATSLTGLVKGNGTSAMTAAVAGTDYLTPTGNGSGLTGLTESQISGLVSDLAAKVQLGGDLGGTVSSPLTLSRTAKVTVGNSGADFNIASGSDASTTFTNAIAALTASRTWVETVYIHGNFTIDNCVVVPSYTRIVLDGTITTTTLRPSGTTNWVDHMGIFELGNRTTHPTVTQAHIVFTPGSICIGDYFNTNASSYPQDKANAAFVTDSTILNQKVVSAVHSYSTLIDCSTIGVSVENMAEAVIFEALGRTNGTPSKGNRCIKTSARHAITVCEFYTNGYSSDSLEVIDSYGEYIIDDMVAIVASDGGISGGTGLMQNVVVDGIWGNKNGLRGSAIKLDGGSMVSGLGQIRDVTVNNMNVKTTQASLSGVTASENLVYLVLMGNSASRNVTFNNVKGSGNWRLGVRTDTAGISLTFNNIYSESLYGLILKCPNAPSDVQSVTVTNAEFRERNYPSTETGSRGVAIMGGSSAQGFKNVLLRNVRILGYEKPLVERGISGLGADGTITNVDYDIDIMNSALTDLDLTSTNRRMTIRKLGQIVQQENGGVALINVADPSNAQDAATKNYIDSTATTIYRPGGTDVAVADGGTGTSSLTGIIKGNGTSAFTAAVAGTDYLAPTGNGSGLTGITESQVSNLVSDLAAKQATLVSGTNIKTVNGTNLLGSGDVTVGGGSPGGSTTQVQFNDAGAFAGDAGLTYDKTTDALTVAGMTTANGFVGSNTSATSGTGTLFGHGGSQYAVTIPTGQQLSLIYLNKRNTTTTQADSNFYGILIKTEDDAIDTGAAISVENNGKADGIYLGIKGKPGSVTGNSPSGIGLDLNRGSSGENSSTFSGTGMHIWDWSTTSNGDNGPILFKLSKEGAVNNDHRMIYLRGNQRAIEIYTPEGTGYDGTKSVIKLFNNSATKFNLLANGYIGINKDPTGQLDITDAGEVLVNLANSATSDTRVKLNMTGNATNGRGHVIISGKHNGFDGTQNGDGPAILEMIGDNSATNPTRFAWTVAASTKMLKLDVVNDGTGAAVTGAFRVLASGAVETANTLKTGGSFTRPIATKTANYTLTNNDNVVLADTTSGSFTLTLPSAVGAAGRYYTLKKIASANTMNITTTAAQTIDGSTTIAITQQYQAITVVSDGTNWYVI